LKRKNPPHSPINLGMPGGGDWGKKGPKKGKALISLPTPERGRPSREGERVGMLRKSIANAYRQLVGTTGGKLNKPTGGEKKFYNWVSKKKPTEGAGGQRIRRASIVRAQPK